MEKEKRESLENKLDRLLRLMSIQLVDGKKQRDQIRLLSIAGMPPVEIAELIGTTPNTVNVYLSHIRKHKGLNLRKKEAEDDE